MGSTLLPSPVGSGLIPHLESLKGGSGFLVRSCCSRNELIDGEEGCVK